LLVAAGCVLSSPALAQEPDPGPEGRNGGVEGRWAGSVVLPTGELPFAVTFEGAESNHAWIDAIIGLVKDGRLRKLEIAKVNGVAVRDTPCAARLEAAGFTSAYKGMLYRT